MKQIIQNYKTGRVELIDVPAPSMGPDFILVKNQASLISIGTERAGIELARKSLLGKAKERPDLFKQVIDKAKKEGFIKTFKEVMRRLEESIPLGYSCAGVVLKTGDNVKDFSPGDKVACIGAGFASHAELVVVPENLCCRIPKDLDFEQASFGMLGAIALHGIRKANLNFGEKVGVIGLGLLGLLAVQILRSYGCQVLATDINYERINLAKKLGVNLAVPSQEFKEFARKFSQGKGLDAVIITTATKSPEPVDNAIEASKFGGRIVVVGTADIHPDRNKMWEKEVEIVVSKAGGPGSFGEMGFSEKERLFSCWTVKRNLEEFLRLVSEGKVKVKPLITHRFKLDQAEQVYKDILEKKESYIGVIFEYPKDVSLEKTIHILPTEKVKFKKESLINVGVIGAGLFARTVFLPFLSKIKGINLVGLSALQPHSVSQIARKYGFSFCSTEPKKVLENPEINVVMVLTRHSSHAFFVKEALKRKKHVYVEKPLCVNEKELQEIIQTYNSLEEKPILMAGYNRRFSKLAKKMKGFFSGRQEPMIINYRVNPGFLEENHWVFDSKEGGSRVIAEVCHFVDFLQFLTESSVSQISAFQISKERGEAINKDNFVVSLKFKDGSVGSIVYTGSGDKAFSRERVEVFSGGKVGVLEDFRRLALWKDGKAKKIKLGSQDMGYLAELEHFFSVVEGKSKILLTPQEIFSSTETIFEINKSLKRKE